MCDLCVLKDITPIIGLDIVMLICYSKTMHNLDEGLQEYFTVIAVK